MYSMKINRIIFCHRKYILYIIENLIFFRMLEYFMSTNVYVKLKICVQKYINLCTMDVVYKENYVWKILYL